MGWAQYFRSGVRSNRRFVACTGVMMVGELKDRNHPELLRRADWEDVATRYRLTARELNTLRAVCRGYSNADVAMELDVSRSTVRTHLRVIYDKLCCTGRVDVILTLIHMYVKT